MILYVIGLAASFIAGVWFILAAPKNKAWVNLFLSAGGAFIITIIFTHILPEIFESIPEYAGIAMLVGFLVQIVLENFSKGIEHGHSHPGKSQRGLLLSFFALCIHAFIEGMPLLATLSDVGVQFARELMLGIMLHKIPVAITLALLLSKSGVKRNTSIVYLLIFVLSTPAGSLFQHLVGAGVGNEYLLISLGLTIGILLHVSTTILFENSDHHRLTASRILAIALGVAGAVFI